MFDRAGSRKEQASQQLALRVIRFAQYSPWDSSHEHLSADRPAKDLEQVAPVVQPEEGGTSDVEAVQTYINYLAIWCIPKRA